MPCLKNKKSHTLIEVLSSAVLFTVGVLAILSVFIYASRNTLVSENKLQAASRGRQLLEDLRSKVDSRTWNNWDLECNDALHDWPGGETFNDQPIQYRCQLQPSGARKVTVIVPWE